MTGLEFVLWKHKQKLMVPVYLSHLTNQFTDHSYLVSTYIRILQHSAHFTICCHLMLLIVTSFSGFVIGSVIFLRTSSSELRLGIFFCVKLGLVPSVTQVFQVVFSIMWSVRYMCGVWRFALNVAFLFTAFDVLSVSLSVLYVIMFDYKAIHILLIYYVQMLTIVYENLKRIVILWLTWRDAFSVLEDGSLNVWRSNCHC
jgi:hypothetical protein